MSSNTTTPHKIVTPTSEYGYIPTLWICAIYVTLFSITTIIHLGQALYFKPRFYWLIPTTVTCGLGEIIGWSGRLWSSKNPENGNAFLIQIVTTIFSPVFLTAAFYTMLGLMINILGSEYSRLKPKTYLKLFVTADVIALVVQSLGGAMASGGKTLAQANQGAHVMLIGIFLQMAGMLLYTLLGTEFLLRFHLQKPLSIALPPLPGSPDSETGLSDKASGWTSDKGRSIDGSGVMSPRIRLMVIGLALSTVFVFIRTIYRTIELLGGWDGHIIRTEVYFNVFDALPVFLALLVLNILPPGLLLQNGGSMRMMH